MSHLVFCFPQTRFGGGRYTHTGGLVVFTLLVRGVTGPEGMVGDVACVWIRLLTERGDGYLPLGGANLVSGFFCFRCVRSYQVERWVVQRGTEYPHLPRGTMHEKN